MVIGSYNDTSNINRLFEIGNGSSDNARANAFTVLQNGNTGIGTATPTAPLSFPSVVGNKISLWGDANTGHYGLGVQSATLQMYSDGPLSNISFGNGRSNVFTERMRIINTGGDGMDLKGRLHIRNGTNPVDQAYGGGVWLYKADNSALLAFMGTQDNQNIGFYGGPAGFGFTYDAINSRVGVGTNTPVNRLDVGGLNNWDLTNTEGDMRIGNNSYRLKFGVALGGGGAGATAIMQSGGVGVLNIGAGNKNMIQVNGGGNFIDLQNISAGIRINGSAGTAAQVLNIKGGSVTPTWVTKPYVTILKQQIITYEFIRLTGIGVYSVPITGIDNQSIFLPEASRVTVSVSSWMIPPQLQVVSSGRVTIEIWESATNTLKLKIVAAGYANGYDGVKLHDLDIVDLNAGFYLIKAKYARLHDTFSGDSDYYDGKLILQIAPN
jgi:hypothetical protein